HTAKITPHPRQSRSAAVCYKKEIGGCIQPATRLSSEQVFMSSEASVPSVTGQKAGPGPASGARTIVGWHAHVYFDVGTVEQARQLCEAAAARFAVKMGRVHERPVGPH